MEELISGILIEGDLSQQENVTIRAEGQERSSVTVKQVGLCTCPLLPSFLPHLNCFLFQALELVALWTMQTRGQFEYTFCVAITSFLPTSLIGSQMRTQCRKHINAWTPSSLTKRHSYCLTAAKSSRGLH